MLPAVALAALLLCPAPALAQEPDWSDDPPPWLLGSWAVNGECESKVSETIHFARGGYRWRKRDGSWGFARGKYSYYAPDSVRVSFKVTRASGDPSQDRYDTVITNEGSRIRKANLAAGSSRYYDRCD